MLQLTKRTEYGLIAMVHLMDREGEYVSAREIAEHYPVPKRLLAEVLKDLARAELVESARGATGGYTLTRPADRISLGEIVAATEGSPALTNCGSLADANGVCDVEPVCPIRSPIQRVRAGIWELLHETSLRSLGRPRGALGVPPAQRPAAGRATPAAPSPHLAAAPANAPTRTPARP